MTSPSSSSEIATGEESTQKNNQKQNTNSRIE
jgi:hypothetical protein